MSTGIRNDSPLPLDLSLLGEEPPDFVDLVHGHLEHGNITVGLEFAADIQPLRLEATVQNIDEWHTQVVSRWLLEAGDGSFSLDWLDSEDHADGDERPYRFAGPGPLNGEQVMVRFEGLLPFISGQLDVELMLFRDIIRLEFDQIRYLGPFRTRPGRTGRLSAKPPGRDGDIGRDAASLLIYDHVRRGGRLITKINEYIDGHLPGWELDVVPKYSAYAVGLRSKTERTLWVNLTDAGTGVAQVLPILVGRALDELDPPKRPILEIVEEPELHLHPSAQAELADLYLVAIERTKVRFLIETHSETFLLRLRRRVAEGRLHPDRLALYFVEKNGKGAVAHRIAVDPLGNVDYWPQGVFAEDFEETRALTLAQLDRQDDNAG
ncbi:hypothetical protein GCM10009780_29290 [Actinomadura alba]